MFEFPDGISWANEAVEPELTVATEPPAPEDAEATTEGNPADEVAPETTDA